MPFPYHINFNAPAVTVRTAEELREKVGDVSLSRLYRAGLLHGLKEMHGMSREEIAVLISDGDGLE
jgi:hypothetical protein